MCIAVSDLALHMPQRWATAMQEMQILSVSVTRLQETWDSLLVSEDEPLEQDICRRELAQQLDALLMELPERQRLAVRLSYGLDGSPPLRQIDVRAPALSSCPPEKASCATAHCLESLSTFGHTVLLSGSQADCGNFGHVSDTESIRFWMYAPQITHSVPHRYSPAVISLLQIVLTLGDHV